MSTSSKETATGGARRTRGIAADGGVHHPPVHNPTVRDGAVHDRPGRRGSMGPDDGMATVEYAIATIAAAGFAGLLVAILRSDEVRGLLMGLVHSALSL